MKRCRRESRGRQRDSKMEGQVSRCYICELPTDLLKRILEDAAQTYVDALRLQCNREFRAILCCEELWKYYALHDFCALKYKNAVVYELPQVNMKR